MPSKKQPPYIFIAYIVVLLVASLAPAFGTLNKTKLDLLFEFRLDYVLHFTVYLGFYVLYVLSKIFNQSFFTYPSLKKIIIVSLVFAIGTEFLQYYTPYRTFNPNDMLFNLLGVGTGILAAWFYLFSIKNKNIS